MMMTAGCHGRRTCCCTDIDECAIGLEPCLAGQQCVNVPGSFHCRRLQRPGADDDDGGGRQSDVAVEVDGDGRTSQDVVTRTPATGTTSASVVPTTRTTTATTTTPRRHHRPSGRLRCGTGFQYNRRTGRCEGLFSVFWSAFYSLWKLAIN